MLFGRDGLHAPNITFLVRASRGCWEQGTCEGRSGAHVLKLGSQFRQGVQPLGSQSAAIPGPSWRGGGWGLSAWTCTALLRGASLSDQTLHVHFRVKKVLMPSVPDPRFTFSGLFESHQGNFQVSVMSLGMRNRLALCRPATPLCPRKTPLLFQQPL